MGLSDDSDQDIEHRYQELCADLNMDKNAAVEAWQSYEKINQNYTLEGDTLHWLACSLYVSCRNSTVPTVGKSGTHIEGNCVSLTRLLRSCKLSFIQFFNKMKKWADMANLPQEFRSKVDRLERNFAVSTVIFKKFKPIYLDIFKDPTDLVKAPRGRKQRRIQCTAADMFAFCWTLFVQVKGNFPAISDDLVNSYHLLLSCMDLMFCNALLADRRDLLNPGFAGLPENFSSRDYKPPSEPSCTIQLLCENHDGLVLEAKGIKEHWWKPHIRKLFDRKTLKGKNETLSGLIDLGNFEANSKAVNKAYEEYVLNVGDFDERIFLGDDANAEIGAPTKTAALSAGDLAEKMQVKRNLQQDFEPRSSLIPVTPLTGRRYLKEKDAVQITPVSTATQSVSKLQALLSGRKTIPSDVLLEIFSDCSRNPTDIITKRVKEMGETFCTSYAQPSDDHPGSHIDFAKKRLQLGESLYYKALENIMVSEKKRLPSNFDFSVVLEQDIFHGSLFACCLEIVIFSYNSQRTFPWIIEIFNLEPYYFYKVIEILIRAEEGLSRDVVKHLNLIEEQTLESLAWKCESPLWEKIKETSLPVPSCEDVILPSQIENLQGATVPNVQLLSSPITHPTVRRLAGIDASRSLEQSPGSSNVTDRFQSPVAGSPATTAKRRLFVTGPTPGTTISVTPSVTVVTNGFALANSNRTEPNPASVLSPAKTVAMALQAVQNEHRSVTYIPLSPITLPSATTSHSVIAAAAAVPSTAPDKSGVSATPSAPSNKPKRSGSVGLFFRKFYHLASVRLRDLCDRLFINDEELKRRIWTCFEYAIVNYSDMMMDRHMDQLLMCSIYVMAKVSGKEETFIEIMRCYRLQPQATSFVYRSVLLCTKKRRHSGSSDGSKHTASGSNSPVSLDKEDDREDKRRDHLMSIRSSSTLPVPLPNSQPPTPTRLAGTGSSFESEDRGDIVKFYNTVFIAKLQTFALKFSVASKKVENVPLSPLPMLKAHTVSPRRRVSAKHSVYISPMKASPYPSPSRPMSYSFNRSPAKDLRAINNMLRMDGRKVGKRLLQDESEGDSPTKRLCPDLAMRKIQNVITERQGAGTVSGE